jgi:hypothetical protein
MDQMYGPDGVESCMVVKCTSVPYTTSHLTNHTRFDTICFIHDLTSHNHTRFDTICVNGGEVRSRVLFRWCRIVYGGEVRGRVWGTCMEQIVPCMEHVVPVLYGTGGDRQYM